MNKTFVVYQRFLIAFSGDTHLVQRKFRVEIVEKHGRRHFTLAESDKPPAIEVPVKEPGKWITRRIYLCILTFVHLPLYTYLSILTFIYLPLYTYLWVVVFSLSLLFKFSLRSGPNFTRTSLYCLIVCHLPSTVLNLI